MEEAVMSHPTSDHGYSCVTVDPSSTPSHQSIKMPVFEKLQQLREKQLYCDLVFDVEGTRFFCHRAIVAAWSPFIHSILNMQMVKKEILQVNYSNVGVFSAVLDYMYSSALDLRDVNLIQVLHLASTFQIESLRDMCEASLRCNLHVGNIISTFQLARKFQLSSLEEYSLAYLQMHLPEAVKQNDFLNLSAIRFNTFLSNGIVVNVKPEVKLFLIISWLGYDVKEREQYFVVLLGHIDWSAVAHDFLTEISQTENFFSTNESSLYLLLQILYSSAIPLGPYTESFPELRKKYSYLLAQVVQNSVWKTTMDIYTPVPIQLVSSSQNQKMRCSANSVLSVGVQTVNCKYGRGMDTRGDGSGTCKEEDISDRDAEEEEEESSMMFKFEEELPKKGRGRRRGLRAKTISNMKTSKKPGAKTKTKLKRGRKKKVKSKIVLKEEHHVVSRRESARISKPVVYADFDNGDDAAAEDAAPADEEEDRDSATCDNDPDFSTGSRACREQSEEEGDKLDLEEGNDEDDFHGMTTSPDGQQESEGREEEGGEEEEEEEEEEGDNETQVQEITKRGRGRPKKGCAPVRKACSKCAYVAKNQHFLASHVRRCHEAGVPFTCRLCSFVCQWSKEYYDHYKEHYGNPPYTCDYDGCTQTFSKIQTMVTHREMHSGERRWACHICPSKFMAKNNLTAHMRCHKGDRPFECKVCQRKFATKNTMNQHMVTHSNDRPYLCDTCGFATKYQSHLIAHRRIHTGDVYHCHFPQCSYTTPKRSQLKAHMRSHLGIRRHVCPTCGKAFVERSHLVRHERIHLDEKPYKCTECDYRSVRVDKIKDHMVRHHVDSPSKYPRRVKKLKAASWSGDRNVVPLPHPPLDNAGDPTQPPKQNPQPLVLSEHAYGRMSVPEDGAQMQHGVRHSTVLEVPQGLTGQQPMPLTGPPVMHSLLTHTLQPAALPMSQQQHQQQQHQQQQQQQQQQMQMLPSVEAPTGTPMTLYTVPTSSQNPPPPPQQHHHPQQQHQQQHPQQQHQPQQQVQQQQQQQQQQDYGGLGAFMALF